MQQQRLRVRYSLCGPTGVALDAAGNVYVADTDNSRVLEYDALTLSAGSAFADRVFGQGNNFAAVLCNQGNFDSPTAASLCFPTGSRWTAPATCCLRRAEPAGAGV